MTKAAHFDHQGTLAKLGFTTVGSLSLKHPIKLPIKWLNRKRNRYNHQRISEALCNGSCQDSSGVRCTTVAQVPMPNNILLLIWTVVYWSDWWYQSEFHENIVATEWVHRHCTL